MEKARRRHVPAFGEWNYSSSSSTSSPDEPPQYSGAAAAESWWWYLPEPEACSDAWFSYSQPARRRPPPVPKKARRPEISGDGIVVAVAGEQKRAVAGAAARAPAKVAGRKVVVRPVDEDLYRKKNRAAKRRLWMDCLGLSCVA